MKFRTFHILLTTVLWAGILGATAAQQGNPFDLPNRKPAAPATHTEQPAANPFEHKTSDTATAAAPASSATPSPAATPASGNPFDVVKVPGGGKKTRPAPAPNKPVSSTPSFHLSGNPQNFLFWVMLLMMLTITVLVTVSRSFVVRIFQAFTNDNILRQLSREHGPVNALVYSILYGMFMINAGILAFLLARHYHQLVNGNQFDTLLLCTGASFAVFLTKHLLLLLIAFVFPVAKEIKLYRFTILIFGIVLGILLVPLNLCIAYAAPQMTGGFIFTTAGVAAGIYLFRAFRSLFIVGGQVVLHKFHFFMYICTVEISPFFILLKIILLQTGLH